MSKTIFLLSPRFESHILKLSRHCCFISKTRPLNLIFDVFPKHLKKKKKTHINTNLPELNEGESFFNSPCILLSAFPHVTHFPPWKRQWFGSAKTTSTKTL